LAASVLYSGPLVLFTDEESKLIEALTNQVIPSDDAPGAVQAGVVYYIDEQLAGSLPRFEPLYRKINTIVSIRLPEADRHCRVHNMDNIYVVDGSIDVNNGGFNPSLTIQAIACWSSAAIARNLHKV